jgi:hypothetical protein
MRLLGDGPEFWWVRTRKTLFEMEVDRKHQHPNISAQTAGYQWSCTKISSERWQYNLNVLYRLS